MDEQTRARLDDYIISLYAQPDAALTAIQDEAARHALPQISLRPHEGRLLQVLARAVNARRIVEIGTLAGYSGTWLARALPDDGRLYTLELNPKHAAVARANFERAGVGGRVEVLEGDALALLDSLRARGPFELVFIDADKERYLQYLDWAVDHLRVGGLVTAHNAFRHGGVLALAADADHAVHAFNRALAEHPRLLATIIGVGDGMAVGVKLS
ncbi:MAG: O-methyltransferase [Aggregatilineales bacterium]